MRWFVRGDVDGFFGLALDNLVQLLVLTELCRTVLGFPDALIAGRILPGAAVSLLVGNVFYGWQAMRLARATGRSDVCALPYGINTPSLFAYIFLVMLPARLAAEAAGDPDPARVAVHLHHLDVHGPRQEGLRGEGEVEDAGRLVGEDQPDRDEGIDASERDALDQPGRELAHEAVVLP